MVFCLQVIQGQLHGFGLHHGHIVYPNLLEVRCDDPPGALLVRQEIIVFFCLFVRRLSVVALLGAVQDDSERLLFDHDVRLGNVYVDAFFTLVPGDFLLEFQALCDALDAEHIGQEFYPVRTRVFVFFAFSLPSIKELSGCFALLGVRHISVLLSLFAADTSGWRKA